MQATTLRCWQLAIYVFSMAMLVIGGLAITGISQAADIAVGLGTYSDTLKAGTEPLPPRTVYITNRFSGPIPTNDWTSSAYFRQWSEPLHAHPLSYRASAEGFELGIPYKVVAPQPDGDRDILFQHRAAIQVKPLGFALQDARVDKAGDWSLDLALGDGSNHLLATIVKGSPYSFYRVLGNGAVQLRMRGTHNFSYRSPDQLTYVVNVFDQPYAIFLPVGATVTGYPDPVLQITLPSQARFFTVAALPDTSSAARDELAMHAFNFVTDTRVTWQYDTTNSTVTTRFDADTQAMQGSDSGTVFALYPHQWHDNPLLGSVLPYSFQTLRGQMKLKAGNRLETRYRYPGLLPTLPPLRDNTRKTQLQSLLDADLAAINTQFGSGGTYWQGKDLGKLSQLMTIADANGRPGVADTFATALKGVFRSWLRSDDGANPYGNTEYFYYDRQYGTLIGYQNGLDEFGSAAELNDHHFHYGYWVYAAAQVALRDPSFASPSQWGGMIELLMQDYANFDRSSTQFPFLRNFDPYEGHSWASGTSPFADGNNQESSSESINAWAAMILWGELTGNTALRDTGIYLYTTEIQAINHYWFDLHDLVFAPEYPAIETSMVWGGKYVHSTWWTDDPLEVHGINWLPITGSSLYLGSDPNFVQQNYNRAYQEYDAHPGPRVDRNMWRDLYLKYLALTDASSALKQWNANLQPERGETRSGTYHWLAALRELGRPVFNIYADTALYAVFRCHDGALSHVAYNAGSSSKTVRFSDGVSLTVPAKAFARSGTSSCTGAPDPDPDPVPPAPYGASQINGGLRFYVTTAPWADVHYSVNNGAQQNLRMSSHGSGQQLSVTGMRAGDVVRFFFTIGRAGGGANDTAWLTVTVAGGDPDPDPQPQPIGVQQLATGLRFYANDAPWADLHYTVNNGGQQNIRMTANGSNHGYDLLGLTPGATVRYFFTIGRASGGATDTTWQTVTFAGAP